MGFLQEFFQNVFQQSPAFRNQPSSFVQSRPLDIQSHLDIDTYGSFRLTDAVRPSMDLKIEPTQGYRHEIYRDEESDAQVPVIMAAASREILFPLFIELVQRLGESVDVVLETSHDHQTSGHVDYYREQIDLPVLISALWDFEDLLLNDGCTGIAVLNPETPQEVQFDEHKLLIMYGSPLEPWEFMLENNGVPCNESMGFLTEADHVHTSSEDFRRQFDQLRTQLGIDADFGSANNQPPPELNF
jgi:hypothetical protein